MDKQKKTIPGSQFIIKHLFKKIESQVNNQAIDSYDDLSQFQAALSPPVSFF